MENKVLAVVAGTELTEKDLNAVIMRYPEQNRGMFQTEQGKKQLVEQLISFELMNKFAKEIKLDESEEYKEAINNIAKEVLASMVINKTLQEVTVTDEEVKNYYNENKEAFEEPATVSAKHILVSTEEEAKKAKNEILSGEISFEDAAKKYSSCPSKEQGGNLGSFSKGMMVPEFEKAAFELEIGTVSEPVQTQFGYHLIKVDAKNEPKTSEFADVKNQIIQKLIQENQEKKYLDLMKELEAKYDVKRF